MGRLDIQIKLKRDFVSQYNKLQDEYGAYMARLNGFGGGQLSYTDFIDNFIDRDTVADASIDSNSNVSSKDIVTLEREMSKPHKKLLSFNKIYYEIQKKFGFYKSNRWLKAEWIGFLYMHDADSASFRSYCFAYDLKDLAEKGLYFLPGRNAMPAKHLITFVDFIKEFVNYNSNRTSGAVGLPNLIPYMFYFWKKDVDNDYLGIKTSHNERYYADQAFQRFIYAVNQNFMRDSSQSAFTNTSVFDRPYFEALFGGSEFPDGTFMIDYEEEIIEFQKWYMNVMSNIRSECMFTFPVSTISLLKNSDPNCSDDDFFVDKEFADWAIKHNMKWSDSNIFMDDSVNSLSNCCFDGNQKVLTKSSDGVAYMTFRDLYNAPYKEFKRNFTIFHNGSWVKGKVIKVPKKQMYCVTTANNKQILVTEDHLNVTQRGDIPTTQLTTDDYLMFNTRALNAVKEVDMKHTYDDGFVIGMYAGDGSMADEDNSNTTTVHFSINEQKYNASIDILTRFTASLDPSAEVHLGKPYNHVYPVSIRSNIIADFIRFYISGYYAFEKYLNLNCLLQSAEFRKGILDGYYLTDGGNSNRIYTSSPAMAECLEVLITSLGLQSVIDISDRTDEPVIIRGQEFKRNYPLYCVRWYDMLNRRQLKDVYWCYNNCVFFKIKSIVPYESMDDSVYCFEMSNEMEPYFTLPNGIITHNCRLKSNIRELSYFNSIGGTALKVGSVKVGTINLARIALETYNDDNSNEANERDYIKTLNEYLWLDLMALDRVRYIIKRNVDKGLLPNFSHGLIDFEHLYNTIGFIGVYETMKRFGYTRKDQFGNTFYTEDAYRFGEKIFKAMRKTADKFIEKYNCDYQINTEQIPGESAADKLMKKDKFFFGDEEIYDLPLYGNQFIPLGIQTTANERVKAQAAFDSYCNGGSILHFNIDSPFDSFEKAKKSTIYIGRAGVTYFAFNTKIQACKNNHAFYGEVCPICGTNKVAEYSRVVGFYTKIQSWSEQRKEEYKLRRWANSEEIKETYEN